MMQLSSKNDDSSICYDVIITHQYIYLFLYCNVCICVEIDLRCVY